MQNITKFIGVLILIILLVVNVLFARNKKEKSQLGKPLGDPNETTNVMMDYPEKANELIELAELHKQRFYNN